MEKLDSKTDGATPDIVEHNVDQLKALFPEIVTEGKIDFETLREVLGDYTDEREERYSFTWNGKSRARRLAQTPSTGTLRPCPEESVNWDTTQNLFIEGENLEVLKLLQKSYHHKIKMIYIDPPYNTGKDFIYPDDFRDSIGNYLRITSQTDEEGKKLSTNPETAGRYHTDWLNMMYPRLKLAKNLLTDAGVFFISIDDNEVANLRKACDEIFGEENFVAILAVQLNPRGRHLDRFVAKTHESVVVYARDATQGSTMYGIQKDGRMLDEYNLEDERGRYRILGLRNRNQAFNPVTRPNLYYSLYIDPDTGSVSTSRSNKHCEEVRPDTADGVRTCWTWSKEKAGNDEDMLVAKQMGNSKWRVFRKDYLLDSSGKLATTLIKSLWTEKELSNDYGRKAVKELFGKPVMDFPKSPFLLKKMLLAGTDSEDVVLDFFCGSSTTAHAVLRQNLADNGSRRFIMVQLPEPCSEDSTAREEGYRTIADIGKERIRRAIGKLQAERVERDNEAKRQLLDTTNELPPVDLGFRVYKLDTSNIKAWDAEFEDVEGALLSSVENIKPDRTEADVLYELLLKFGLDLAVPMEQRDIVGKPVHIIGAGALVVCLANEISLDVVEGIAALKQELTPETIRVVFKDAGFADDVVKTNAVQILHQSGIEDVRSL